MFVRSCEPIMPKLRLLVVDDHAVFRRVICALLSQERTLEVICQSATGEDAVRKTEELRPDLVVLDIGLPGISGIEAARQILQGSPTSKIIFLSQHDSLQMANEASNVGGRGYVAKIDAASELLTAIRSLDEGRFFVSQQLRRQGWTEESQLGAAI
jgi:DNA-binding NarL/FixJ family response regulator